MVIRKAESKSQNKIICDAYRSARKLCEYNAAYFLTFTYYLREIAKLDFKKGFGNGWRKTIQKWYCNSDALMLAEAVTKVGSIENWSHKDILSLCHLKAPDDNIGTKFFFIMTYYFKKQIYFTNLYKYNKYILYRSISCNVVHSKGLSKSL